MNLNEECLLQFLNPAAMPDKESCPEAKGALTADLKRIIRHKQYVSFPQEILLRRSAYDGMDLGSFKP